MKGRKKRWEAVKQNARGKKRWKGQDFKKKGKKRWKRKVDYEGEAEYKDDLALWVMDWSLEIADFYGEID